MSDSDSEFSAKDPSDPSLSELSELSDSEPDAPYERGMDVDIPLPPPALPQQTVKRRTQAGVLSNLKERENVQLSAGAAEQQHDLATILAKAIDTYIHSHQLQHSEPFVLAPPTPKKGRPKKGHAAASKDKTAKIEQDRPCSKTAAGILVEILDGKMVCPVKSCPKSFGSGPGLKYHLANTKHDVNEFLEAVYKDDTTTFELVKQQVGSMNQGWAIVLDEYPVTVPKSGSTCPMFELSKRRSAHSAKAGQPSVIGKHFRGTKMANLDEFPKREMLIARDDEPDDISSSVIEFNDSHFELIDDLRAAMHLPADFQLEIDTVARSKASMSIDNLCSAAHPSLQNTWFLNAGGPVWALEWCPSIDEQGAQYLAVGCFKTMDKQLILGQRVSSTDQESKKDSLQVWRVPKDAKPELAYCIVHDYGPCVAFKWHPDDQV